MSELQKRPIVKGKTTETVADLLYRTLSMIGSVFINVA